MSATTEQREARWPWSKADVDYLRRHYGQFDTRRITDHLKRSDLAIRLKVHRIRKEQQANSSKAA